MEQFSYLKKPELGKEYTPSKWVGDPKYTKIMRLNMTCGGGMGGQSWYEYVYRQQILSNNIMSFTRYDGKEILLNTSYLVEAEYFTLAKASLDVSDWIALGGTGEKIRDFYVLIDDGKILTLK